MGDQNDRGSAGLSPRLKTSFMVIVELRMPSESIYYGEPKTLSWLPKPEKRQVSALAKEVMISS